MSDFYNELREHIRSKLYYIKRFGRTPRYDTSDVIQEACLRIHQDFESETVSKLPDALLKRIVFAQLANQHRFHRAQKRAQQNEALESMEHEAPMADPQQYAESKEFNLMVLKALDNLAPEQRAIASERLIEEKTFVEIAENHGKSIKIVRRIYQQAIGNIKSFCQE